MNHKPTLSRRTLLYGSAAAAGAVMLSSCAGGGTTNSGGSEPGGTDTAKGVGSKTEPLPKPAKFSESPELAKLVKSGDLPPVEERLPENPLVTPHNWVSRGKYGGTMRTIFKTSDDGAGRNFMYGHSPMRFLNDGLDVGPGLAETWDHNADASEWTFVFRKGLKWSDGHPWSVDDILFWWEHMALDPEYADVPPDELKSGNSTPPTLKKIDDVTLEMTFDSPAPLAGERLAMWVNGQAGKDSNGPKLMVPSHFAEQFHPATNPDAAKDALAPDGEFDQKVNYNKNPECPTMNAWMVETYQEGRQVVWVRNPYYYGVSPDGDQLPYVDEFIWTVNPESTVGKVDIYEGKLDIVSGKDYDVQLADIPDIDKNPDLERFLWDSGSGTGSLILFNYDHPDDTLREVYRNPKFRQAISHAINRAEIRKAVYFETGFPTTGTLSPKAMEYVVNDEGKKVFEEWRDSYIEFDLDKAKQLLDEVGVKEGSDGQRTYPDGSPAKIIFNFDANNKATDNAEKNNLVKQTLAEIGIEVILDPVNHETFGEIWETGQLSTRTDWEVGDGPNHLLYPQWLAPIEPTRYTPLEGKWYQLRGTEDAKRGLNKSDPWKSSPPRMEPEPGGPIEALHKLYDQTKIEPDEMKRTQLVYDMIKIHIEHGPFFIGTVANTPRVVIKQKDLKNVPAKENLKQGGMANPWIHPTPAVYDPEIFYWENPEDH